MALIGYSFDVAFHLMNGSTLVYKLVLTWAPFSFLIGHLIDGHPRCKTFERMNELAEKMHGTMKQTAIQNGHGCMESGEGINFSIMDIKDITESHVARLILGLHLANERCCYKVMLSLIGWVQI